YRKPPVEFDRELVSFADPVFEKAADSVGGSAASRAGSRSVRRGAAMNDATGIARLPETADEAREVAAIVGGRSELYLRDKAQEHTAKTANMRTVRFVHFATHGLLAGEFVEMQRTREIFEAPDGAQRNLQLSAQSSAQSSADAAREPQRAEQTQLLDAEAAPGDKSRGQPALMLSLSGDLRGEDGLLTMTEIMQSMDLNAQLVVLSACNTAGENDKDSRGEGFAGLTRAFMYAGARGLLVSHWSVNSK